ncbi:hypothetical protein SCUP234_03753 [Seiridium cupressi]
MLNAFRRAPLRLTPSDASGGDFAYIEAWQNIDATGTRTTDLKAKTWENYEVQDWAWRQGPFARASSHKDGSKFEGGLRILFAQSELKHRQAVPGALISSQVLEALQLPASTFASFQQQSGVFSCHIFPEGTSIDECKRLTCSSASSFKENKPKLTRKINNLSTWLIFTKRSPQWDINCIKFLLQLLNGNQRFLAYRDIPAQTFRETLDYVQNYSEAGLEVTQSSEARMHLQLNILYTSVAQDDGQTSARLAASAGKDSTSMKIIALITAAYLPATFVANPNDDNDNASKSSVSPDFWIYWAVAVPLTIITLAGWATWWKFEQHRFDLNVQQAIRDKPPSLDSKPHTGILPGIGKPPGYAGNPLSCRYSTLLFPLNFSALPSNMFKWSALYKVEDSKMRLSRMSRGEAGEDPFCEIT